MWSRKALLSILNVSGTEIRKFSCGGGVLLGSILWTNKVPDEGKKSWTVEYPKVAKQNDVLLSRKVTFIFVCAWNRFGLVVLNGWGTKNGFRNFWRVNSDFRLHFFDSEFGEGIRIRLNFFFVSDNFGSRQHRTRITIISISDVSLLLQSSRFSRLLRLFVWSCRG